jgi:hypothetical protein
LIDRVQTRRYIALTSFALLAWCAPYYAYVPVTSATFTTPKSVPPPPPPVASDRDASGELPSTAETEAPQQGYAPAWGALWFFPFFPIPPVDIGRGYDPNTVPAGPGYAPRYQPIAPAYGPGGGSR